MNFTPRPLPKHRRARLIAWALAMLAWMAQVIFAGAAFTKRHERQRGPRMSLDRLTRMVKMLIISRAIDLAGLRWRKRYIRVYRGRNITPRGSIRAIIGSRVRRHLKRKDKGERIGVLIHAIRHLDRYAALVAKRMKRRLTRRSLALFAAPPAPAAPVTSLAMPAAFFADSS
ncbi:MAG: hypothetical protein ACT4OF_05935 [Caulobacteraceae bacterium]